MIAQMKSACLLLPMRDNNNCPSPQSLRGGISRSRKVLSDSRAIELFFLSGGEVWLLLLGFGTVESWLGDVVGESVKQLQRSLFSCPVNGANYEH